MPKKNEPRLDKTSTSGPTPPIPPATSRARSKADRREAAQAELAERKRRERRRTILIQAGVGLAVVVIVAAVAVFFLTKKDDDKIVGDTTAPPGLTSDGGILFGAADAPVTLSAVEDFQCPICQEFEKANADLLKSYRDGSQVAVEYRPIAFLDRMSSTKYSSRADNAAACVLAASGKDAWLTFHQDLYENQPAEQSAGLPDSKLISMASDAGATGDSVATCINDQQYAGWVQKTTQDTLEDVTGTPTLYVNGTKLSGFDADTITKAVAAAGGS
jgi:protein-disulfide isomerase